CFLLGFVAIGCGVPGPLPTAPETTASAAPSTSVGEPGAVKQFDPCDGSPPLSESYHGILRTARCDQERYLKMSDVTTYLGVGCKYCHAPDPKDPKKEDYLATTPKKEIANWMSMHLMQAVKPADGTKFTCRSCHTDDNGKPIAKILGTP